MSKINILPASVYNRIAAGEVVDRPYSVVKELIENAIDAGATEIQVYVEEGGKQLIRVVDNGCGIAYDDLQAAFMPHATSKIEKANDLENIITLGFRGEAVASIASVSKMTITSKTLEGKCYSLTSNGGELGEIVSASGENGTEVKVETLFFNTPVRLGFLKSDKAEETDITNFISRFILCKPEIAFTYYVNGKRTLQSFGGGREEALVCVYGADVKDKCIEVCGERNGIKIRGYIGNTNFSKPNKTYQSVFLNGRYILNNTISTAVMKPYMPYLMKRQYPFYVLYIDVPPEIVDVNVHPNKSDVRFADNNIIFGTIYRVISDVLDGTATALNYTVSKPEVTQEDIFRKEEKAEVSLGKSIERFTEKFSAKIIEEPTQTMTYEDAVKEVKDNTPYFSSLKKLNELDVPFAEVEKEEKQPIVIKSNEPYRGVLKKANELKNNASKPSSNADVEALHANYPDLFYQENVLIVNDPSVEKKQKKQEQEVDYFAENKRFLEELELKAKQNKIDVSSCRFVGKIFNTYLLYERGDELFIIDQHAAHERLIFNKLKDQMSERKVVKQSMLIPYELKLNAFESAFIRDNLEYIREIGFDIEEGTNEFLIYAVPVDLQNIDLAVFFNDILGDISGFRSIKLEDLLKDKLATAACKAAVKGGMDLSQNEIDALFRLMDGDMGLKCPHGRPVVVRMKKTEFEKMFKRIV